jgi:hypothetical protein
MVRAKFTCVEINEDKTQISLTPVINGSEENKKFFSYTPGGSIKLNVVNPSAAKEFEVGKEYYVDFTSAVDTTSPAYEPKMKNAFVVEMKGVPAFLIKEIDRPRKAWNNIPASALHDQPEGYVWDPIKIVLYDPIAPSAAQAVYAMLNDESGPQSDKPMKKDLGDIVIKMLGPAGDVVEKWTLKDCKILEANFGNLSFNCPVPSTISIIATFSDAILEY